MHALTHPRRTAGFSLIELVIVVVIIGIIGAIAIPRLSRGAAGANDSALVGDLAVLRNAIDLYATEHGGAYPALADLGNALTQYSNAQGDSFSATKDAAHIYGPYLRKVPPLTVGNRAGETGFTATPGGQNAGWYYIATTGEIRANTTVEADAAGTRYSDY